MRVFTPLCPAQTVFDHNDLFFTFPDILLLAAVAQWKITGIGAV